MRHQDFLDVKAFFRALQVVCSKLPMPLHLCSLLLQVNPTVDFVALLSALATSAAVHGTSMHALSIFLFLFLL